MENTVQMMLQAANRISHDWLQVLQDRVRVFAYHGLHWIDLCQQDTPIRWVIARNPS